MASGIGLSPGPSPTSLVEREALEALAQSLKGSALLTHGVICG